MKKTIISFLFIFIILIIPEQILAAEDSFNDKSQQHLEEQSSNIMDESDAYQEEYIEYPTEFYQAKVLEVIEKPLEDTSLLEQGFPEVYQVVKLKILDGKFQGQDHTIDHINMGNAAYDIWVDQGDKVMLFAELTEDSTDIMNLYISDFVRWPYLRNLTILFIVLLIMIGKWQGFKSLIGLGVTALAVIGFLLPMMLKGYSPIILAILVCIFSSIVTIIIVGGFSIKSLTAILGTLSGVLIAGILSFIFGNTVKLTGLSAQEAQMLMYIPQGIIFDFRGLLFAGIIIGALGAVMDVSMSISSAMDEIRSNNTSIHTKDLVKSGLVVGRDIMGTMSNTLILAYTGSAIPLLLLFMAYETSIISVINMDLIATEIVRALTGSIGLLTSIPITAIMYGLLRKREEG